MRENSYSFSSPMGSLYIAEQNGAITDVAFHHIEAIEHKETPLIARAMQMLTEYFDGTRRQFDLPLAFNGTEFQLKAWNALLAIPYGETRSYKEQAITVGNPKAVRAVGAANGKNPISIIVPCHRVIGADGSLVGFGGGLELKRALLDLERRTIVSS